MKKLNLILVAVMATSTAFAKIPHAKWDAKKAEYKKSGGKLSVEEVLSSNIIDELIAAEDPLKVGQAKIDKLAVPAKGKVAISSSSARQIVLITELMEDNVPAVIPGTKTTVSFQPEVWTYRVMLQQFHLENVGVQKLFPPSTFDGIRALPAVFDPADFDFKLIKQYGLETPQFVSDAMAGHTYSFNSSYGILSATGTAAESVTDAAMYMQYDWSTDPRNTARDITLVGSPVTGTWTVAAPGVDVDFKSFSFAGYETRCYTNKHTFAKEPEKAFVRLKVEGDF